MSISMRRCWSCFAEVFVELARLNYSVRGGVVMNKQRGMNLWFPCSARRCWPESAGFALSAGATPVCYQWSGQFSKERFVLDIEKHSGLSRHQHAFSVHGKHVGVCGYETIATVTGTIGSERGTPPGHGSPHGSEDPRLKRRLPPQMISTYPSDEIEYWTAHRLRGKQNAKDLDLRWPERVGCCLPGGARPGD